MSEARMPWYLRMLRRLDVVFGVLGLVLCAAWLLSYCSLYYLTAGYEVTDEVTDVFFHGRVGPWGGLLMVVSLIDAVISIVAASEIGRRTSLGWVLNSAI